VESSCADVLDEAATEALMAQVAARLRAQVQRALWLTQTGPMARRVSGDY
jgi:hypothetical protein